MVEIRFKQGTQFNKLRLMKYVYEELNISSLKEAKAVVESGVIKCPDHEYNNAIKRIAECGGIQICEQKPLPAKEEKVRHKPSISVKPNKNKTGLIIESCVPISEHTFQDLEKNYWAWVQIANSIPFIVRLTQLCEKETNEFRSLLAVEVPESHNTINEIVSLSKIVDDIHAGIIGTVYKFHSLTEKFNPFIDDVEVEAGSDSHD